MQYFSTRKRASFAGLEQRASSGHSQTKDRLLAGAIVGATVCLLSVSALGSNVGDTEAFNADTTHSMYAVVVKAQQGAPDDHQPIAQDDTLAVNGTTTGSVIVLANDSGLEDGFPRLELVGEAANGSVQRAGFAGYSYTSFSGFSGQDSFRYRVTDSDGDYDEATVFVTVTGVAVDETSRPPAVGMPPGSGANKPPVISGQPPFGAANGIRYSFTPHAFDPEGDRLRFSIQNRPGWAVFNSFTGTLTGTPTSAETGAYAGIVIAVSDGVSSVALPPFAIVVYSVNGAPQITGQPAGQAAVGKLYAFAPVAADPDGDALMFSVVNLPAWATFSQTTGSIQGVPQAGDVGTYDNIVVTVSDGELSDSLPGFSLTVDQMGTGSVTLSWTAPTQNEDGSPLLDLVGYKLYYGSAPANYSTEIVVDNPGITAYVFDGLTPGIYYFAAKAVDGSGLTSELSTEVMANVAAD